MLLLIWGLDLTLTLTLTLTFSLALFPCVLLVLGENVGVGLAGCHDVFTTIVFLGGLARSCACIIRLDIVQDKAEFTVNPAIYLEL